MPWGEVSIMSLRREFVMLAGAEGANVRALCRRFGVSPTTGYKWLERHAGAGVAGLSDRSRRPCSSPRRTAPAVEAAVVALRQARPCWGGRKLRRRLLDQGLGPVPSASTITAILRRHGLLEAGASGAHAPMTRFERAAPNELWQMDFKGHFAMAAGRCHPLTVLDDHARYALGIEACGNEQGTTVQGRLVPIFRRYGLPEAMLMDNGSPWGDTPEHRWTPFTVWLARLGVRVLHGRPYHPQTQGKEERFHRTLKAEAIGTASFRDLAQCQRAFDAWREIYNFERPHEALGLATPATRYRASERAFPERLPELVYAPDLAVRRVHDGGWISFAGRAFRVPKAFRGLPVALRPTRQDGCFQVLFAQHAIAEIDLADALSS